MEIVENYVNSNSVSGWANLGTVINALKATPELKWANPLEVKNAAEKVFVAKFGAKEAAKPKGKVSHLLLVVVKLSECLIGVETCVYASRVQSREFIDARTNTKNRL